jgi:hypothetical protein
VDLEQRLGLLGAKGVRRFRHRERRLTTSGGAGRAAT